MKWSQLHVIIITFDTRTQWDNLNYWVLSMTEFIIIQIVYRNTDKQSQQKIWLILTIFIVIIQRYLLKLSSDILKTEQNKTLYMIEFIYKHINFIIVFSKKPSSKLVSFLVVFFVNIKIDICNSVSTSMSETNGQQKTILKLRHHSYPWFHITYFSPLSV